VQRARIRTGQETARCGCYIDARRLLTRSGGAVRRARPGPGPQRIPPYVFRITSSRFWFDGPDHLPPNSRCRTGRGLKVSDPVDEACGYRANRRQTGAEGGVLALIADSRRLFGHHAQPIQTARGRLGLRTRCCCSFASWTGCGRSIRHYTTSLSPRCCRGIHSVGDLIDFVMEAAWTRAGMTGMTHVELVCFHHAGGGGPRSFHPLRRALADIGAEGGIYGGDTAGTGVAPATSPAMVDAEDLRAGAGRRARRAVAPAPRPAGSQHGARY